MDKTTTPSKKRNIICFWTLSEETSRRMKDFSFEYRISEAKTKQRSRCIDIPLLNSVWKISGTRDELRLVEMAAPHRAEINLVQDEDVKLSLLDQLSDIPQARHAFCLIGIVRFAGRNINNQLGALANVAGPFRLSTMP